MSYPLCFETICVEDRKFRNLDLHEQRLNRTRRALWGYTDHWNLSERIVMPDSITSLLHKCRLTYQHEIDTIRWEPYAIRTIRTIQRVYDDSIDYAYKYEDRTMLDTLFAQRNDADEILIIKNGMVTDSQYCNVAFRKGKHWLTPSTPLLPGTQRAFLLRAGWIEEADIRESELDRFSHVKLFNAMLSWEIAPVLDISAIR